MPRCCPKKPRHLEDILGLGTSPPYVTSSLDLVPVCTKSFACLPTCVPSKESMTKWFMDWHRADKDGAPLLSRRLFEREREREREREGLYLFGCVLFWGGLRNRLGAPEDDAGRGS